MSIRVAARSLSCVGMISVAAAVAPPAGADPPAPACLPGYVWRAARPGDAVCVTPGARDTAAQENAAAPHNVQPNDGNVCKAGFVWRNAFNGDAACVTPAQRDQAAAENAAAASHTATQPVGCQQWRPAGPTVNFIQEDGRFVTAEITGRTWGPYADFSGGGKPEFHGKVTRGTLDGSDVAVAINWDNGWTSQLEGHIYPDGTARGGIQSFPPANQPHVPPAPDVNWHAADKFLCG